MRGLYFIKHSLAKAQAKDLHEAVQESLAPIGLQSFESKDDTDAATSPLRACQKNYLSALGIFDLSGPDPEAYLEIGINLGLNRPSLIIAGQGMTSAIPSVLDRANTWFYRPPLKPSQELRRAAMDTLDRRARAESAEPETQEGNGQVYCVVCGSLCKGWRKQTHGKGYLVLDGTHPQWNTIRDTIQSGLSPTGLTPIYLTQLKGRVMPLLCEMRLAALASEFVLLDLSAPCDPEQYILLGLAISLGRPWLLTTSQPQKLPHLLKAANRLEYGSQQELQQNLEQYVMKSLYPTKFAAPRDVTAQLELPFWLQLEDWIAHFQVRTSGALEGALQLLLIEEGQLKQRCRMTPNMTIKAGRDPECDLVIEAQAASRFHADFIFTGQELHVVDHQSTNGTFVNGNRVPPEKRASLEINDRVRIGTAEVVIWDEDELPGEVNQYLPESGRIIPQTIFVNLSDGLVLANGKIPVARLTSSEIDLLAFMSDKAGDTTTTSEAAEIVFGTGKVSRMIVASAIDSLRAKIEPSPSDPRFLLSVPGVGYRLRTRGGQLVLGPR
ncbi:MAG: FHA domain-containing protein [Anaerolineales bacterium]|nr:MAG: FHA domain-containing protein [Anaerolineales bacterium]